MRSKSLPLVVCCLLVLPCLGAGCYSVRTPVALTKMVVFDDKGRAMDPTGNVCPRHMSTDSATGFNPCNGYFSRLQSYRELKDGFSAYLDALFRELALSPAAHKRTNQDGHTVRRVLLFIHGGLNSPKDTIDRAYDLSGKIMQDKFDEYFPIFINWQSSLPSSWLDHVLFVRSGQWYGAAGVPQAPFYLAADAAHAVGRAPIVWGSEVAAAEDSLIARFRPSRTPENLIYCQLRERYNQNHSSQGVFAISKGPNVHTYTEGAWASTKWALTSPFKFGLSPLLDAVGSSAWSIMERRTRLLFHDDPEQSGCCSSPSEGNGGLAIFLRRLREEIAKTNCHASNAANHKTCIDWEITLIAHSAGAIVANDILRVFPDIHFSQIVYMAAACSIRDYEESVWPYLELPANETTRFAHLTLHELAEVREATGFELPPRGSLLVWIDDLFSHPLAPRDRTAGRFRNLMLTISSTPEGLRPRISIKAFGVGKALAKSCPSPSGPSGASCPQHHGDFSGAMFWRHDFWTPEPRGSDQVDTKACSRN